MHEYYYRHRITKPQKDNPYKVAWKLKEKHDIRNLFKENRKAFYNTRMALSQLGDENGKEVTVSQILALLDAEFFLKTTALKYTLRKEGESKKTEGFRRSIEVIQAAKQLDTEEGKTAALRVMTIYNDYTTKELMETPKISPERKKELSRRQTAFIHACLTIKGYSS